MTGVMINTIARRVLLNPTATVLDTLRQVQSEQLEISKHENIALSELQSAGGISVTSLFHTILNFRNEGLSENIQKHEFIPSERILAKHRNEGRDG